jgi:hypothetical protein
MVKNTLRDGVKAGLLAAGLLLAGGTAAVAEVEIQVDATQAIGNLERMALPVVPQGFTSRHGTTGAERWRAVVACAQDDSNRVAFVPADRRIQRALTEGLRFERGHASVLHVGEQLMPARPMELLLDRGLPWGIIASDP